MLSLPQAFFHGLEIDPEEVLVVACGPKSTLDLLGQYKHFNLFWGLLFGVPILKCELV